MHPRFAQARRAEIASPAGRLEAVVAEGFRLRLRGLAGLEPDDFEPLLFPRCRSIHTFGMRAPIDLVWLRESGPAPEAIGVVEGLPPRRRARAPHSGGSRRAVSALELVAGDARRLGLEAASVAGWAVPFHIASQWPRGAQWTQRP